MHVYAHLCMGLREVQHGRRAACAEVGGQRGIVQRALHGGEVQLVQAHILRPHLHLHAPHALRAH